MPLSTPPGIGYCLLYGLAFQTAPAAGVARGGDDLAPSVAGGAGGHLHHGSQEGLAHLAHFAASAAGGALHRVGAGFSAFALAGGADFVAGDLDLFFDAKDGFFKGRGLWCNSGQHHAVGHFAAAGCRRGKAKEFSEDVEKSIDVQSGTPPTPFTPA